MSLQVFISWSGKRSEHVALALRSWLPKVLDNKVAPFVSSGDIDKGDRGLGKIAGELEESGFGIVVVTPTNQNSSWINFEAGALGKSVTDGRVAPLLVGLTDSDVRGPIKQFQNSEAADPSAVRSLVRSLNKALKDPLSDGTVDVLFQSHWPELQEAMDKAPEDNDTAPQTRRDEADLLDEVLTTVRSLQRDVVRMQNMMKHGTAVSLEKLAHDVLDVLADLDASPIRITTDDAEITAELPDDAGTLDGKMLRRLQKAAQLHGVSVKVVRSNGASIAYASDGTETRTTSTVPAEPEA